jgi:urease accessory protein
MRLSASALLLADSRTPTGAYAHSSGLEAAVEDGLTAAGVESFLRGRMCTVGRVDASLAAAAARLARAGSVPDLLQLDREAEARCASPPLRRSSSVLGRSLLRTGATLWPSDPTLPAYREASSATPRAVAFGVVAHAAGIDPEEASMLVLYEDAAGVASAAVKLLPVDGAAATAWVAALASEMETVAAEAARPTAIENLPSACAPLLDARSLVHDTKEARLFVS